MDLCNDVKNKQVSGEQQSVIQSEMGAWTRVYITL